MNRLQWKALYRQERLYKKEIWKPVLGYEGRYEVSNLWRMKSLLDNKWKRKEDIMNQTIDKFWYNRVMLSIKHKNKLYLVHRLVAQWFLWLDILDSKSLSCHIDDVRTNNCVSNLFVWSHKDNMNDMINKWRKKIIEKAVIQYTKEWVFIKEFKSWLIASIETNTNSSSISSCCHWRLNYAGGYVWKFAN